MDMDKTIINVDRLNFTESFLDNPPNALWEVTRKGNADNNFEGTIVKHTKPERIWVLTGERDLVGGGYLGLHQPNE